MGRELRSGILAVGGRGMSGLGGFVLDGRGSSSWLDWEVELLVGGVGGRGA